MSEVKVNKISPRTNCGTVTLGDSGDSFVIPAGATITNNGTQTGFGRTGTVDWDTTAKTAGFTAVSGTGYFVNTTSGAITVTLPATPSAGDIVSIADYAGTAATNNITIARNGSNFEGGANNGEIKVARQTVTLVYVDGTQGWVPVNENDSSFIQQKFVTATGGTVTTCGDYKIHTFTGPGTFCVSCAGNAAGSNTVDYLVIAGGGAGGHYGGGGGAGGYRESSGTASGCYTASPLGACVSALPVTATGYPITVGGGGTGSSYCGSGGLNCAPSGSNSVFSTITSTGGGGGGAYASIPGTSPIASVGKPGGSGGGGAAPCAGASPPVTQPGGTGNTPPVSPPQGNSGGFGATDNSAYRHGGGGGGAGAAGTNSNLNPAPPGAGDGGAGVTSSINTTPTARGGGGGGGSNEGIPASGSGGTGGGGAGSEPNGVSGTANTGGGGGGTSTGTTGSGGSGIVIIRYKYQ